MTARFVTHQHTSDERWQKRANRRGKYREVAKIDSIQTVFSRKLPKPLNQIQIW